MKLFSRVTVNPDQMGGAPCVRGLRILVSTIIEMLGEGITERDILATYPDLELGDIRESVRFETVNRCRVLRAIRELNLGKYSEYEGPDGLRQLSDKVKSRGRRRLAMIKSRKRPL